MIIGIGCDIIEVARIKEKLTQEAFKNKVFTEEEIAYCEQQGVHRWESYSARFAGKEAVGKAFGVGLTPGNLKEISITKGENGQPQVKLTGKFQALALERGCKTIHLSLSHIKTLALAQAILEG